MHDRVDRHRAQHGVRRVRAQQDVHLEADPDQPNQNGRATDAAPPQSKAIGGRVDHEGQPTPRRPPKVPQLWPDFHRCMRAIGPLPAQPCE